MPKIVFVRLLKWMYETLKGSKRRSIATRLFDLIFRLEGGPCRSPTVRELLQRDYQVEVGKHSYGEVFVPGAFAPSVRVGRYVSVAKDVRVFTQNHPIHCLTTHPYFYEGQFGYVAKDMLEPATTVIDHDVWIGQSAIILPGCKHVGIGAIIGAGAVVTKDVPPYAIVVGNPARIIRYRFEEPVRERLLASEWWLREPEELAADPAVLTTPMAEIDVLHSFWRNAEKSA